MNDPENIDTVVYDNELACHDTLPVMWQPLIRPLQAHELAGMDEANLLLLQACVAVEEYPQRDNSEELGAVGAELARLDFKLNLVLQLLGRMVNRGPLPEAVNITFNTLGATWTAAQLSTPAPLDSEGVLRIQLSRSLPQWLELPSRVVAVNRGEVKVRFTHVADAAGDLISRLAFLRHRRHVAEVRKARVI